MSVLDLLFPRKCLGCKRTGSYFCADCLNFLSLEQKEICPICERPAFGGLTHPRCKNKYSLDGLTGVFAYKGLIKSAITKLKYRFISDLAKELVDVFVSFCGENKIFSDLCRKSGIILVPIPLHRRRENWRGFNQSALLGRLIAKNLGLAFSPDMLIRIKNTTPQMQLKEKERMENIKNAFSCSSNISISLSPNILLFDDVWTTGSTLKEAGGVLKRNGIKFVWGLTLAR